MNPKVAQETGEPEGGRGAWLGCKRGKSELPELKLEGRLRVIVEKSNVRALPGRRDNVSDSLGWEVPGQLKK